MAYRLEQNEGGQTEIVIDGFEKGIAPDQFSGISDMRGIDIVTELGCACINAKPTANTVTQTTTTFTVVTNNVVTPASTLNVTYPTGTSTPNARVVTLTTTGVLPTGLATGTKYYVWVDASMS